MPSLPRSFLNQARRPGRWADSPLDFDRALSTDVFNRITKQVRLCEMHEQERLRALAQGPTTLHHAAPFLKELLGPDLLDRCIEEANSAHSFHVAMGPAMLVWALNEPQSQEMDQDLVLARWVEHCLGSRSTGDTVVAANLFMAQLLELVPHLPVQYQASTALHTLEALYRSHTPWKNPQHTALNAHYLELSHAVTRICACECGQDGLPMGELWRQKAILALSESSRGGYAFLAQWLAQSELPVQDKIDVLAWSNPRSWADPCVAAVLLPSLPESEQERFAQMPWEVDPREGGGHVNQTLMQTYCPQMHALMALVVQEEDWLNRECMDAWARRMGAAPEPTLDLPDEFAPMALALGAIEVQ